MASTPTDSTTLSGKQLSELLRLCKQIRSPLNALSDRAWLRWVKVLGIRRLDWLEARLRAAGVALDLVEAQLSAAYVQARPAGERPNSRKALLALIDEQHELIAREWNYLETELGALPVPVRHSAIGRANLIRGAYAEVYSLILSMTEASEP